MLTEKKCKEDGEIIPLLEKIIFYYSIIRDAVIERHIVMPLKLQS